MHFCPFDCWKQKCIAEFPQLMQCGFPSFVVLHRFPSSLCPEGDSNSYAFRRSHLKRVRLPIPPSGQKCVCKANVFFAYSKPLHRGIVSVIFMHCLFLVQSESRAQLQSILPKGVPLEHLHLQTPYIFNNFAR